MKSSTKFQLQGAKNNSLVLDNDTLYRMKTIRGNRTDECQKIPVFSISSWEIGKSRIGVSGIVWGLLGIVASIFTYLTISSNGSSSGGDFLAPLVISLIPALASLLVIYDATFNRLKTRRFSCQTADDKLVLDGIKSLNGLKSLDSRLKSILKNQA